jgi:dynein heavy chain 2, cytosolic
LQVPGLFTNEELDAALAPLKDALAAQGLLGQSLFTFFTSQVRQNLRIVVCLDPSSPDFRLQCEANPALFTRSAGFQP